VLYLDRPLKIAWVTQLWMGRFGYRDLKEAAFSGGAALWELEGV
jgi:hypothetical protein